MGGHYGSIHVRTEDAKAVEQAVAKISGQQKLRFLIGPAIKGWVSVYPENNGQDSEIGGQLAAELATNELIQCLVYDDDIFAYWFYQSGALKDRYNSCPTYFDENNTEPRGSDAAALEHLLIKAGTAAKLQELLDRERFDFEMERFDEFAALLDLPNAVTAYEYLQDGERDGIKLWSKFIHVPDLGDEKAAKRAETARVRAEMQRLKKEGVLLADLVGDKASPRARASMPAWSINPATNEVLFGWQRSGMLLSSTQAPLLRLAAPDWKPAEAGIKISCNIHKLATSRSGRWFAAGNAYGDWSMQLWDLHAGKVCLNLPQARMVSEVRFSGDEQILVAGSESTITVISLAEPQVARTIQIGGHVQDISIHPNGATLAVVDNGGFLHVVDAQTGQVQKRVWIKDKKSLLPEGMIGAIGGDMTEKLLDALKGRMSAAEIEKYRIDSARHFMPKDPLRTTEFSADGKWIFCGARDGLYAVEWESVLSCAEMGVLPHRYFVEADEVTRDLGGGTITKSKLIYAVVFDEARQRVLFTGLEGKVRFLELENGLSGDLLVPPDPVPIFELGLLTDRSALVGSAHKIDTRKQLPVHLQVWNYPALCAKAGIPF